MKETIKRGKVRQLDDAYIPHLREEEPAQTQREPSRHQLNIWISLPLSKFRRNQCRAEIVLEKLIDTLMRTAIEHAGAERGVLILPRGIEQRIVAEATTSGDTIVVRLREALVAEVAVPESIVHYVVRTQESVILDDAAAENPFSGDAYIRQHHARSILCLPLINQAKLIGLLYLENNLTPHVFTPTRIAVLKLLYVARRPRSPSPWRTPVFTAILKKNSSDERRSKRLVDACNIIGIFIWNFNEDC